MQCEQIKTLHAVVSNGSISRAADMLCKTQPAVSMALKKLEQSIGFELFDRANYRLTLTAKGERFYQACKPIIDQLETLSSMAEHFNQGHEERVVIAVEGTVNLVATLSKFKHIQNQFGHTELHIKGVHLMHGLRHVRNGEADLAITPWLPTFSNEGDFATKLIDHFSYTLCGKRELFAQFNIHREEQINEEVLQHIPQLSPTDLGVNIEQTDLLKAVSHTLIRIDDVHCYMAALSAGLGWGPINNSEWNDTMAKDFIRFLPRSQTQPLAGEIRIVKPKNKVLGPVAQAIWNAL